MSDRRKRKIWNQAKLLRVFFSDKLLELYPPFRNYISVLNAFSPWFHLISPKKTHGRFGWRSLRHRGPTHLRPSTRLLRATAFKTLSKLGHHAVVDWNRRGFDGHQGPCPLIRGNADGFSSKTSCFGDSCFGKHRKNGGSSQRWSKIKIEIYLWRFWLNLMIDQEYLQCSNCFGFTSFQKRPC